MFGNLQEQQEKMEAQLREIVVHGASGGGAVKVIANGSQEVTDISIDKDKIDLTDVEQLEDMILLAVEDALNKAKEEAAAVSQNLLKDMLPPGMGNLGGLFG
ncbi:MAG: YbaB/EbfC family nucleoid-associated protein [Bacteroidota bacterium]